MRENYRKVVVSEKIYAAVIRTNDEWIEGGTRLFVRDNRQDLQDVLYGHLGGWLASNWDDEEDSKEALDNLRHYGTDRLEASKRLEYKLSSWIRRQTVEEFEVGENNSQKIKPMNLDKYSSENIFAKGFSFDIIFHEKEITSHNSYTSISLQTLDYIKELESKYSVGYELNDFDNELHGIYANDPALDESVFSIYKDYPLAGDLEEELELEY